ncbi:MAG TPA: maltose alpha-D-glucosyltransferase [Rhodothermales bacterium]|nr:maltose alpha-D-glucosyltransferase [Rhodothermales bacterium]
MSTDFLSDPLWYKDAVIYELHVRSFFDANNDGFGDFEGLQQKLPYLESLGVNTLWLLPFLESPLRDDGYDTSDYYQILPVHGTLNEFRAFLDEAHSRGIRVITELVLNHTSDQHLWFQEARDPASPKHDWYVWSDDTEKYSGARIIFTDTEVSNWAWDRKAGQYYWHRFFSHQPDLNYDNPEVREAMKEVMFYWLDMGVDGLRLDAVPYLYEREGTNCENLPETIDYIVELQQAIEARYGPDRILLAEANQWPEDTLPYFANGRGVQMAFNFPIMPRMYMALRRENRRPLVEMLELTEDIPQKAQWALFLRNHDELTLEMVTDEERDYMYHEYAADPRFRINVGIRRRLAPLLGGERRRIELMNALILSLKGSPILYYGDEIGMGDDPFLGDRNGVRTPMQWSPDKNGGFSRAPHYRLFMPAISHGQYSYEFVNVEDSEHNPHSLLNFMKRMLALRNQYSHVFGRGSLTVVPVENQSVLAFVREHEGEKVLIIANLSRFSQSAFIPPLDDLRGHAPVEMFSKTPFPTLAARPYHFVLGPYGFYWFALVPETELRRTLRETQRAARGQARGALPIIPVKEGLQNLLVRTMVQDRAMERLEEILPSYLKEQRWFGAKGVQIEHVVIADAVRLAPKPAPVYMSILQVAFENRTDTYVLPLTVSYDEEAERILSEAPEAALAWMDGPNGRGLLHDATVLSQFWISLFEWWRSGGKGRSLRGIYSASPSEELRGVVPENVRLFSGEQSNSAAILNDRFFIKLYRRLEAGVNPETEILEYLTRAGFKFTPKLYGTASFDRSGDRFTIGIVQEALPVDTDGWTYALQMVQRFLERVGDTPLLEEHLPVDYKENVPVWLEDVAPEMLNLAHALGVRTAEMHWALSRAGDPALQPVDGSDEDIQNLAERIRREAEETRQLLARQNGEETLPVGDAAWEDAFRELEALRRIEAGRQKIRIHGDFHLGQVIRAEGEFYILDFEGEPARTIEERRARDYALKDVAGMLRSMEYVALAGWRSVSNTSDGKELEHWTSALVEWCKAVFLHAYFSTAEGGAFILPPEIREPILWAYLFEKVLYEVRYELNNRPDWVWLALRGLRRMLDKSQPMYIPTLTHPT